MVTDYINSNKALIIIGGILLAVVVAFIFGAIVQYFARIIFSFNTKKSRKYFGAIWGGMALTAITFFMFIKGFKHSFMSELPFVEWVFDKDANYRMLLIIAGSFVTWTIIFQVLKWLFKINVLKIVVLAGTFALAMAFAGNDLVNFIGVPLAGFSSFELWQESGQAASDFNMGALAGKVWRIGLMGHSCNLKNVLLCVGAFETVLSSLGVEVRTGVAEDAARAVMSF